MSIDAKLGGAIAVTRFGLGARPGEIEAASADPRAWLLGQIRPDGADLPRPDGPSAAERFDAFRQFQQQKREAKKSGQPPPDPVKFARKLIRDDAGVDFLARVRLGATTDAGFRERWALFFANHFTVSAAKFVDATLIGPFEAEAIRPHVFGRFEDLLAASTHHPAMLLYLDQAQSIGPDSPAGRRRAAMGKPAGLNENLAREAMELHSVGVEAGYSQTDVTEFARALTGWSIGGPQEGPQRAGRFVFRPFAHEPGARTVMGRRYPAGGEEQARAVLADLAANPHTAHHLGLELGRHFVADDPPASLTQRLAHRYTATGGDLAQVAQALITAPEAWQPAPAKFKQPYEFMISSWRAAGTAPDDVTKLAPIMTAMGQQPFSAPSPKGWPEDAHVWSAPDAIVKRMTWSEALAAAAIGQRDPMVLADNALGARLTPAVARAIGRAETRAEGLSILLMSPEFQRR